MIFTENQKTILSVDFDRDSTCRQKCPYCYVENMENIYPTYLAKVERNSEKSENYEKFADKLNKEYEKIKKSRAKKYKRMEKVPVRIYGSGDFVPSHYEWLKLLDFRFFMFSKNLCFEDYVEYIPKLLKIDNLTMLNLSFDKYRLDKYSNIEEYKDQSKIRINFTGTPDEFEEHKDEYHFDVFFNIDKRKKKGREKASEFEETCPAECGKLDLQKACTYCNKCTGVQI